MVAILEKWQHIGRESAESLQVRTSADIQPKLSTNFS